MGNNQLAAHETLELREFLSQEVLGLKKINSSLEMAKDQELKGFMKDAVASKKTAIKEIQSTLSTQMNMQ